MAQLCDLCDVCGDRIVRDQLLVASSTEATYWLGVCECPNRRWRWRSATGDTPWVLIGADLTRAQGPAAACERDAVGE